jgi:hypothetical protein
MEEQVHEDFDFKYPTVDDPLEFVEGFLQRKGILRGFDADNPGKKLLHDASLSDPKAIEKLLMAYRVMYNAESKQYVPSEGKKLVVREMHSTQDIKQILDARPIEIGLERIPAVKEHLSFIDSKKHIPEKYISQYLKSMKGYSELNVSVFMHWMWQVKRFIWGYHVPDPLFLNIFAKQGTGKTTFIRGMYDCLSEYTYEGSLSNVGSEGHANIWSSKYIVFFDELKVNSEDRKQMYNLMANLKYLITMKTNMRRMYHTQEMADSPRTFSAISTSNHPLINTLYDDSGMRRFYEIVCYIEPEDKSFEGLPYIDNRDKIEAEKAMRIFKNMWRGIDELREYGYITADQRIEMEKIQFGYKRLNCIEMYEAYEASEGDLQFIGIDDNSQVERIEELAEELKTLNRSKFVSTMRDKGFLLTSIMEYRKNVQNWAKDDQTDIKIFGLHYLAQKLTDHGYYILRHLDAEYLVKNIGESPF